MEEFRNSMKSLEDFKKAMNTLEDFHKMMETIAPYTKSGELKVIPPQVGEWRTGDTVGV